MKITKKFLAVTVAVIGITGLGLLGTIGVGLVAAQANSTAYPKIVQNLATKFNLNPTDVQKVFDQTKSEQFSSKLDNLVEQGTITSEQKTLIVSKRAEYEQKISDINNKSLTQAERNTELRTLRDELSSWATTNKIPEYLLYLGGRGMKGGFGRGMMEGGMMGGFRN